MAQVVDFSGRPPTHYPNGIVGAVRYIAPRRTDGSRRPKCITEAELNAHRAAGRHVGFVFEDSAVNSDGGASQGDRDGGRAVAEMKLLGVPGGVAIYAAIDHDVTVAKLATVAAYLDAFHNHTTAAGYRRGVYGEYDVVTTMLRDGHVDLAWQTVAWSGGKHAAGPGVVLYQRAQQVTLDGTVCDLNDVLAADWGQWNFGSVENAPTTSPVTPPAWGPIYKDDDMQPIDIQIAVDKDGRGYVDVPVDPKKVINVVFNTANPPDSGYKPSPDWARLNVNGRARIVVEEALPNGKIDATVWVAA